MEQQHAEENVFDTVKFEEELYAIADRLVQTGGALVKSAQHKIEDTVQECDNLKTQIAALKREVSVRIEETTELHKTLAEAQSSLLEVRRSESSLKVECAQLNDSLAQYRKDVEHIETLNQEIIALKDEKHQLSSSIEEMRAAEIRTSRLTKEKIDTMEMRFQQEKLKINESTQTALDQVKNQQSNIERLKAQVEQSTQERQHVMEDVDRIKMEEKTKQDKLKAQIAELQAQLTARDRQYQDALKDQAHQSHLEVIKLEQQNKETEEKYRSQLDEKTRDINLLQYRLEQQKDDNRKALESIKQDFENQLNLRSDEIRRHYLMTRGTETPEKPAK